MSFSFEFLMFVTDAISTLCCHQVNEKVDAKLSNF
jgi:hypothetical protein